MKNLVILPFLFFSLVSASASSDTKATISGFVKDSSNGETMIYVNVFLKRTDIGTTTNKSGYYVINKVPPGRYTVVFTYIGYRRKEIEVSIEKNQKLILNVELEPQVIEVGEIVVTSERFEEYKVKISDIRLTPRQLTDAPQMVEADLMRTLQMLPGVLTLSEFSSGLYVRGGTPDQNLILLDGTEVYNPSHLFGVFSTFNIDAVKEVELLKGGFPAEYGGRLSSVLNITNMDGNQKRFEGKAAVSLISAKTTLQGPILRGSWFFSSRRTYFDQVINLMRRAGGKTVKEQLELIPDYYFYDMHLKIYQDLTHQDKLSLTFYSGQDNLGFTVDPFELDLKWGNRTFSSKWTHIFSDQIFSNFIFTASSFESNFVQDNDLISMAMKNTVTDYSLKADLEYFPNDRHVVKTGMMIKDLDAKLFQRFGKEFTVDVTNTPIQFAAYGQDDWKVTPLLTLRGGVRLNVYYAGEFYNSYDRVRFRGGTKVNFSPRFAFRYRTSEKTAIKGSWGIFYQFLNVAPMGNADFSFLDIWFPSDNSITPAEAIHYIIGIETELPGNIKFDWEGYYKDMNHLYEFREDANRVLKTADLFYRGKGYSYGSDIFFEKKIGNLAGWFSYSLGWTKRKFPALNKGREYFPKYDRRNSVYFVGKYKLSKKWTLNFGWNYGTGQAFTRPLGRYQLILPDTRIDIVKGESLNASRLPPYHRLDAGITYETSFKRIWGKEFSAYFQVFNFYNRRNLWFHYVDFDFNPAKILQARMLPIIPTFGFELKF